MKIMILPLVALSFLCASPAPATAVDTTPAKVAVDSGLRQRFCDVCDELAKKAVARNATREDYNRAVQAVRDLANAYIVETKRVEAIQDQLIQRIMDLQLRAKDKQIELMEFDALKDKAIDIELAGCLARMANMCRQGKATRLEYAMCYQALTLRANYAKDFNPEIEAIVGRLKEECQRLEKRAAEAIAGGPPIGDKDLEPVWSKYWDVEAQAAVDRLGKGTILYKLPAVDADFAEIRQVLLDSGVPDYGELIKKVDARLDEYRNAVLGGRITRLEYQNLCDLLCHRARAAVNQTKT